MKASRRPGGAQAVLPDAKRGEGRGSLLWLQGLACGAMVALAPMAAAAVAVLLTPSVLAVFLDRQPGRPVARAIFLCQAAACVAPVRAIWSGDHTAGVVSAVMSHPYEIGSAWCAAAGGWLLTQLLPIAVSAVMEAAAITRAAGLRRRRERIEAEWDLGSPDNA
ncbi:MAG TPA: hypothetical protein VN702_22585 [Acetobacteraceae bacterium]|nr:hypothetical protein [Acetobacteraceae bacterium]